MTEEIVTIVDSDLPGSVGVQGRLQARSPIGQILSLDKLNVVMTAHTEIPTLL